MDTVVIRNIKGIKKLEYNLPNKKGVYIVTGANGTGKTSLLAAIDRIGNSQAYAKYFKNVPTRSGSISYNFNNESVEYKKINTNWMPHPKSNSHLLKEYKYNKTFFLTTNGIRFYLQSNQDLSKIKYEVSDNIKNTLNEILSTNRYDNLKYIKVSSAKGRQKQLHRNNKLYVLKGKSGAYFSELDFSLGERLLLNILDYLDDVEAKSLLLIDELELALHPIAQVKLYEYLYKVAKEKDLVIIISTHSSTLIKIADNIHYLENHDGIITTLTDVKSAYILKEISIEDDNRPDCIFFVEDEMANMLLTQALFRYQKIHPEDNNKVIKIIPVGGYEQVLSLMAYFYGVPPFSKKNVHAFLDSDVRENYETLKNKSNLSDSEYRKLKLFEENSKNFKYLSITPELGVWKSLVEDASWLESKLISEYTGVICSICDIITDVNNEECHKIPLEKQKEVPSQARLFAKGCFKNLYDKLHEKINNLSKDHLYRLLFSAYVEYRFNDESYKNEVVGKIKMCLNKI